ncbi:hypothetical protein O1K_17083 [Xanthomonas fragariae LMG 25863]|nr:hypothetical protein O1K_17083 [Xanthomonas fragariae LMG 25863]
MAEASAAEIRKKALEPGRFEWVLMTWPDAFQPPIGNIEQPREPAADICFRLADAARYAVEMTQLLRADGQVFVRAREKLLAALKPRREFCRYRTAVV